VTESNADLFGQSDFRSAERMGGKNMASPILVTGAAGRVGAVGRTLTEMLLKQGKAVSAMVQDEDERAQALRDMSGRTTQESREWGQA
jgi:nucleoside-diphosphate-sugar epimerase